MQPPFSAEQFFEVLRRYNETVWPAQWGFYALALVAVIVAGRGQTPRAGRIVSGILALLWLWMGVVYHLTFFRAINPAATLFGALFIVEAGLLAWTGVWRTRLVFRPQFDWASVMGGLLLLYGLVLYPMLGLALGHRYPATPTFGLPCPTTIFTIGLLLWATPTMPRTVLVIPMIWSALGLSAAVNLGVREDFGLLAAGVLAAVVLYRSTVIARTATRAA
jgi:uncharacterized protein DUF6064